MLGIGPHSSEKMKYHISYFYNASYNITHCIKRGVKHEVHQVQRKPECGPMPNVMVTLPNIGRALCSTLQSLADAHYSTAVQ